MSIATEIITTILYGLTYGMILVLVSLGLSLIFGLMGILNFAHGALFVLGGYLGLTVLKIAGGGLTGFILALILAPLGMAVIGAVLEKSIFKPLYEFNPLYQLLLTFGLAIIIEEGIKLIWGAAPPSIPPRPEIFSGSVNIGAIHLSYYRVFILIVGTVVILGTSLFLSRTRYGHIVRAGMYDADKTAVLGLNVNRAFTVVFGLGAATAGLGGVVYIYRAGLSVSLASSIILVAFIVVIIGGLGSFRGTVLAGFLVGIVWQFTALYIPTLASAIIFLLMIAILLWKPQGLLGEAEVDI